MSGDGLRGSQQILSSAPFWAGDHVLRPPADECSQPAPVSAVAVSCCGNFGFVGSASGRVDRYNMQSGLHRGSYQRCVSALPLSAVRECVAMVQCMRASATCNLTQVTVCS